MNRIMLRNVLVTTAVLCPLIWYTTHDSRLAAVGYSSSLGDFIFAFLVPLLGALIYELIAAKLTKGSHKLFTAGAVTFVVCLIWVELAANGIHEAIGIFFN